MIWSEPRIFYREYLKDYHIAKATYLKKMLDDTNKFQVEIYGENMTETAKDVFRRTLKSDLRQTYFHAIETFFELFIALNPKGKKRFDDENILFNLTNSKWRKTYEKIKQIAEDENTLDFLDEKINYGNYNISIGHYLFYFGWFNNNALSQDFFESLPSIINAIKYGIRILARDFIQRDEYNAYKHGLRIIPYAKKMAIANRETLEILMEWDMKDSMSFYRPIDEKKKNELQIVTKLFDPERDYRMTRFCGYLIHHLVFYRRLSMKFPSDADKISENIEIRGFSIEDIKVWSKVNVELQDLVETITKM